MRKVLTAVHHTKSVYLRIISSNSLKRNLVRSEAVWVCLIRVSANYQQRGSLSKLRHGRIHIISISLGACAVQFSRDLLREAL